MQLAGPAVDEGERLGERLADDVAGFFGLEELRVERRDADRQCVAVGREVGIECFEVVEDCLFGTLHLHEVAAGDSDDDDWLLFVLHNDICFDGETVFILSVSREVCLLRKRFHLLRGRRIFGVCAKKRSKVPFQSPKQA